MMEHATFAAGCFWGIEARFAATPGVLSTTVGYMGGMIHNPSYEQVCTDTTGHAEVVYLNFDPEQVSYDELLELFWNMHNPTSYNFQGADVGSQYRSAIFYYSNEQRQAAEASKATLANNDLWQEPIVTQIVPAAPFYPAEEYHQQYLAKRGMNACHF